MMCALGFVSKRSSLLSARLILLALLASAAMLFLTADRAYAVPLYTKTTAAPGANVEFGRSVATGDVNGDGRIDFIVGANGESGSGGVTVYSGNGGGVIWNLASGTAEAGGNFGFSVAAGDTNSDGKADILVGAPTETVAGVNDEGRAYLYSGMTGGLMNTFTTLNAQGPGGGNNFGISVAMGDVNNDARADIIVGAYLENVGASLAQGRAYVFNGNGFGNLATLTVAAGGANFGYAVAAGDVNGDSRADVAVGAPFQLVGAVPQGRTHVFSGNGFGLLFSLDTPNAQASAAFGSSVAMGDATGDGLADILVGTPGQTAGGNANQGRAYVFSSPAGAYLYTLDTGNPGAGAHFGGSVATGDANADGRADFLVGAFDETVGGNAAQGQVYLYSGLTGTIVAAETTTSPNPQADAIFGRALALADISDDGKADLVVGAPWETVAGNLKQGRAYVFLALGLFSVGGVAELPDVSGTPQGVRDSSGGSGALFALWGAAAAVAVVALAGGAWYAMRRRER